jgi:hypothetical protein
MFTKESAYMSKLLILLLLIFSSSVYACKCTVWHLEGAEEKAEYVLADRENVLLVKITSSVPIGKRESDTTQMHYFELLEDFKGNFDAKIFPFLISGSDEPNSCTDNGVFVGKTYLLYTNKKEIFDCSYLGVDLEHEGHLTFLEKVRGLGKKHNQTSKKDAENNRAF